MGGRRGGGGRGGGGGAVGERFAPPPARVRVSIHVADPVAILMEPVRRWRKLRG